MQPPPPPIPIIQNSKGKRLLMDPEVIEIQPPVPRTIKHPKLKQVVVHEVIDVENDEDCPDVIILDEKVDKKSKGKTLEYDFDACSQLKDVKANYLFSEPKSSGLGSHTTMSKDGISSDLGYQDNYIDMTTDEFMDFDEYAFIQAHFDNVDIPPGIEAPIPCLLDSVQKTKKTADESDSSNSTGQKNEDTLDSWSSMNSLGFVVPAGSSNYVSGADPSSPWLFVHGGPSKNKPTAMQHGGSSLDLTNLQNKNPVASSSSSNYNFELHKAPIPHNVGSLGHYTPFDIKNQGGANNIYFPSFQANVDDLNQHPLVGPSMSWFTSQFKSSYTNPEIYGYPEFHDPSHGAPTPPDDSVAIRMENVNKDDILRKYQLFKRFDTVEDHSDHHYNSKGCSTKQPPKSWAKKIQEEWRILENDLPDAIFVRVYESRMDLLRAVIIGAEGTPYHDGLFFFDVFFPSRYPNVPPLVYYHSGGLRLNPNLYGCGKVCLSLLGTWHGNKNEKWQPGVSTVLQVLVSIQALILNQKPFFNEPGYESMSGSPNGEMQSQQYNEKTFMLSLKTMVYLMRRPPKHFEDFVLGHFHKRANDILVACKAYIDGAQVGCLVKGGVQDVDEGDKSCSKGFKDSLPACVDVLLKAFSQIGIEDTENFQNLVKGGNNQAGNVPLAAI